MLSKVIILEEDLKRLLQEQKGTSIHLLNVGISIQFFLKKESKLFCQRWS